MKKKIVYLCDRVLFLLSWRMAAVTFVIGVAAISFSCDPVKRLEKMKAKYCPYCIQPNSDSILTFLHDSTWVGDTIISIENPFTYTDTVKTVKIRTNIIYKTQYKEVQKVKKVGYAIPYEVIKYKISSLVSAQIAGFWILLIIFALWMTLQFKNAFSTIGNIKNLFKKKSNGT